MDAALTRPAGRGQIRGAEHEHGTARRLPLPALAVLLAAAVAIALAMTPGGDAHAQAGVDPTQPPTAFAPKLNATAEPAREQRLQAVIRRADGSRIAVIGGQTVSLGESITTDAGPARVAAIFDDRVVLARGTARETLALLPSITSKPGSASAINATVPRSEPSASATANSTGPAVAASASSTSSTSSTTSSTSAASSLPSAPSSTRRQ